MIESEMTKNIVRSLGFASFMLVTLLAGCKKECDEKPEPEDGLVVCTTVTSRDPVEAPVVLVGSAIETMQTWLDTDGLPGLAGQDNMVFYTSKEDIDPGPGTSYDLRIHLGNWYEDSTGFISSSIAGCYDWLHVGDTISPYDHLVAYSSLYQNMDPDSDCAMFVEPRYIGFVRIAGQSKYCGYMRVVPIQDTLTGSYGFGIDRVRLAECPWGLMIIE